MRWLCFLLLASPGAAAAQGTASQSLRFDLAAVPATRDSFVFHFRGQERGWAVWQFEIRPLETTQQRSEEHTSEFQSQSNIVCRLLLEKKKQPSSQHGRLSERGADFTRLHGGVQVFVRSGARSRE